MDTLNLDIKKRIRADRDVAAGGHQLCQADLVGALNGNPLLPELGIVNLAVETLQEHEILEPLVVSKCFRDKGAQLRIGLVQPTSGCDTIGLVDKLFFAVVRDKVLEDLVGVIVQ